MSISPLVLLKCSIHHPTPPRPHRSHPYPPRLWPRTAPYLRHVADRQSSGCTQMKKASPSPRDGAVRLGGGTAWQRGKTSKDGHTAACGGDGGDGRGYRSSRGGGGPRRQEARPRGKARSTLAYHPSPIWRGSTPYWGIGCQTRKYVGRCSRGPPHARQAYSFRLCIALWRDAAGQGHNTRGPALQPLPMVLCQ